MKKHIFLILIVLSVIYTGCDESDFSDNYADPNKIAETTVSKQFAGVLQSNKDYVLPAYWNYFVVLRTSLTRYTQAVGWANELNQYVTGAASIDAQWGSAFYNVLVQYRQLELAFNELPEAEQQVRRVYMVAATIYLYDFAQKTVDLFGDIPFTDAGRLSQNGGDYLASLPAYDSASSIYTKMLDDLQGFADELNTITLNDVVQPNFETADFLNGGDLTTWKKYCNSLRLRMLNRVAQTSEFSSRAQTEIAAIVGNPGNYPVVDNNSENVQLDVIDLGSPINSKGFRSGLEDWNGNLAGKAMIDHMVDNSDPRLRAMYEPGEFAGGVYQGLNPLDDETTQNDMINDGLVAIYNRSTLSRNEFFPGMLFNAAEINLIKAEYYLHSSNDAMAQDAYEMAIEQSIEWYYWVRTLSADGEAGPLTPTNATEIADYIASGDVDWSAAATTDAKLNLIATQKWIHFSVVQLHESWAEQRRLDLPALSFQPDNAGTQATPPVRWLYPDSERSRNTENFQAVQGDDNLTTKMFWDN